MTYHELALREVEKHADGEAASLVFDVPESLRDQYRWQAGQHIGIELELEGERLRRSYSISTADRGVKALQVTVKKVSGGRVSSYLVEQAKPGDKLNICPPVGSFTLQPTPSANRSHYFFAAGSGITPIMAMIEAALAAEPYAAVYLLYGSHKQDRILFEQRLNKLIAQYPKRLVVSHVISSPSWLSGKSYWRSGRVDRGAISDFIDQNPPYAQDTHYYLCGPGQFNADTRAALKSVDVPENRINQEAFGVAAETKNTIDGCASTATVIHKGHTHTLEIKAGESVLDAAIRCDVDIPYSCQSGVCGTCRAVQLDGMAEMANNLSLSDTEVAKGLVLCCQLHPQSPTLKLRIN